MKNSNRRKFLRNVSLLGLGAGIIPKKVSAKKPIDSNQDCNPTTKDLYGTGPFYTADAPLIENNQLAAEDTEGQRIIISGRVMNLDCTEIIPNTEIDIWHADHSGAYDNEGYNLRGKTYSNEQGFYLFETIQPGLYLNGNTFRPSHIHIKITPPGYPTISTQLYFEGDEYIEGDPAASETSGTYDAQHRIISLNDIADGKKEGNWDIIIDGEGIETSTDLHLEQGMLYELSPNPFTDQLTIRYGVFKPAKISLSVFDLQGRLIADLTEKQLPAEKYEVVWKPEQQLQTGHYFIALKANDLQVHHRKVMYVNRGYGY